eukprot:TRINITY_DN2799_c0_g2_i22.p1 TRINITY_DN2799_c0_g2~~TRINITY_DN2799_c0_g2_i22.p1  ORF type:complete len:527 (+),score=86.30 TRINITY_DN2799_c0_g2_i22:250-1830(+)
MEKEEKEETRPCTEFFLENSIFATMSLMAINSNEINVTRSILSLSSKIVVSIPAHLIAQKGFHEVLSRLLDFGICTKPELLILLRSLIYKLKSFPYLATLFVIELKETPSQVRSYDYQLMQLLAALYNFSQYRQEVIDLLSLLLEIPISSHLDEVSGESLGLTLVYDLTDLFRLLSVRSDGNSHHPLPQSLGMSKFLFLLDYCNRITNGRSFPNFRKFVLNNINSQLLLQLLLPRFFDSDLSVVNMAVIYLREILLLFKEESPLCSVFLKFLFSDMRKGSGSTQVSVVGHLGKLLTLHCEDPFAVNILRLLCTALEWRGREPVVNSFILSNISFQLENALSEIREELLFQRWRDSSLPNFQPTQNDINYTNTLLGSIKLARTVEHVDESISTNFGKDILCHLMKLLSVFTENSFEFNIFLTGVISCFLTFPDKKVLLYFVNDDELYTILHDLKEIVLKYLEEKREPDLAKLHRKLIRFSTRPSYSLEKQRRNRTHNSDFPWNLVLAIEFFKEIHLQIGALNRVIGE